MAAHAGIKVRRVVLFFSPSTRQPDLPIRVDNKKIDYPKAKVLITLGVNFRTFLLADHQIISVNQIKIFFS